MSTLEFSVLLSGWCMLLSRAEFIEFTEFIEFIEFIEFLEFLEFGRRGCSSFPVSTSVVPGRGCAAVPPVSSYYSKWLQLAVPIQTLTSRPWSHTRVCTLGGV